MSTNSLDHLVIRITSCWQKKNFFFCHCDVKQFFNSHKLHIKSTSPVIFLVHFKPTTVLSRKKSNEIHLQIHVHLPSKNCHFYYISKVIVFSILSYKKSRKCHARMSHSLHLYFEVSRS